MHIRVKTGERYGTNEDVEEVLNADFIRSISPKTGYKKPMCTVWYLMGTRGHWESSGANTIVKEIIVYHSFDEMCIKLGIS